MVLLQSWNNIESQASELSHAVVGLCWALGAVFGLVGAIKIFSQWQLQGHHHFQPEAHIVRWFWASGFLLIAGTIIKIVL